MSNGTVLVQTGVGSKKPLFYQENDQKCLQKRNNLIFTITMGVDRETEKSPKFDMGHPLTNLEARKRREKSENRAKPRFGDQY